MISKWAFFFFLLICRNFNISSRIDLSRVIQVRLEFRVVDRFWWNIQHNSEMTQWQLQSEWILEPILQNLQISLWINWSRKIQNRLDSKVVFRFSGILQLRNQVTWIVDEFCNLSGSTSNIILRWLIWNDPEQILMKFLQYYKKQVNYWVNEFWNLLWVISRYYPGLINPKLFRKARIRKHEEILMKFWWNLQLNKNKSYNLNVNEFWNLSGRD